MPELAELCAGYPVVIEFPVAWGEMDAFQHVNNAVYFRYFENVRLEYIRRLGWAELQEQEGVGPILASISARFKRPLTYPDTVAAAARIANLQEDRMTMDYLIVSRRHQTVTTEGTSTIVSFNYREGKKAPIPDQVLAAIRRLQGP